MGEREYFCEDVFLVLKKMILLGALGYSSIGVQGWKINCVITKVKMT